MANHVRNTVEYLLGVALEVLGDGEVLVELGGGVILHIGVRDALRITFDYDIEKGVLLDAGFAADVEVLILQRVGEFVHHRLAHERVEVRAAYAHHVFGGGVQPDGGGLIGLLVGGDEVGVTADQAEGPQFGFGLFDLDAILLGQGRVVHAEMGFELVVLKKLDLDGMFEVEAAFFLDEFHHGHHPWIPGLGVARAAIDQEVDAAGAAHGHERHGGEQNWQQPTPGRHLRPCRPGSGRGRRLRAVGGRPGWGWRGRGRPEGRGGGGRPGEKWR